MLPIGKSFEPYIIAEMSGNHNNSLKTALSLVKAAKEAGASAIKIQTFKPESMTLDIDSVDFVVNNKDSIWYGKRLFDLYSATHLPYEWHNEIFSYAKSLNIDCFSSPFDKESVDFLESLGVKAYKIASFECIDIPLIKYIASKQKPMIISTGMATVEEVKDAYEAAVYGGSPQVILLKCTSSYPASPSDSNISAVPLIKGMFKCEAGLSDHTLGVGAAVGAVALGATVIEKHLVLDRNDGGIDASFSLEPNEFSALVEECNIAWKALGKPELTYSSSEIAARGRRRSLYFVNELKSGELITEENVRSIRPGKGLPPKWLPDLIGKKVTSDVAVGTPVSWDLIE